MGIRLAAIAAGLVLAASPSSAETIRFIPKQFYTTWSFAHPPALHIKPGDRVVTKTVDASGVDWDGKQAIVGVNPQTGPFFIEGAMPGDTVAVHFVSIEPRFTWGVSTTVPFFGSLTSTGTTATLQAALQERTWIYELDLADRQIGRAHV